MDKNGMMCDGKLVRARGVRKLFKKEKKALSESDLKKPKNLKYLLATRNEIFKFIHSLVEKKVKK